jgi:imidazole glycerol phosphate synthase subunit HisF
VQGVSRALFEEVRFDERTVQSVDWVSYPILEIADAPESIEIATINRPDQPSGGAGEPAHLVDGLRAGADAVLCASIFHYGEYTIPQVREALREAGVPMRP